jgi:tetratricopeptide (TPR) repeat protein
MWLYDGHNAMMVGFDGPEFEEDQYQEFLDDKECNPSLDVEEEFISLDFPEWSSETLNRLQEDLFKRGDLWMASAIYQRLSCGRAPLRLRVRRLDEELEMKPLMQFKQRGNEMFANQKYQDAIDLYDEAMMTILTDIFVGPYGQIEQIVTVLSNKAECELRQGDYNAAAATATDALVLMGDHEKTRIRRAKAELAIAKKFEDKRRIPYLVQAEMDLYEVLALGDDGTSAGRETAEELNTEVAKEMEYAKYALLETTPEVDFDRLVLLYGSSCK